MSVRSSLTRNLCVMYHINRSGSEQIHWVQFNQTQTLKSSIYRKAIESETYILKKCTNIVCPSVGGSIIEHTCDIGPTQKLVQAGSKCFSTCPAFGLDSRLDRVTLHIYIGSHVALKMAVVAAL